MSQAGHPTAGPDPGIRFPDIVRFLARHQVLILVPALAAAVLTALVVYFVVPAEYEASAVLVIVEPRFSSELKPPALTVQAYQNLLESDAILAETRRRLQEQGQLEKSDHLRRNREVETKIFVSRRAEETSLAPMIQVVATGRTPAQAAAIANTWADVFLEQVRRFMGDTTTAVVHFIDGQYPQTLERLAGLEEKATAQANESQARYNSAATRWDGQISAFNKETADLMAGYRAESRRLLEEFMSQRTLETRRVQLATMRRAYADVQAELDKIDLVLKKTKLQLATSRTQLKDTPEFVTLQKAMSDDAVWQEVAQASAGQPDWTKIRERTLNTQIVNPVYTDLSGRVLQLEMEVNASEPRKAQLIEQLATMTEDLKVRESALRSDEALLDKLQQEREAGLSKLQEERTYQLGLLNRSRQQELDALKREGETALAQIDRNITQQKGLFDDLVRRYNQAQLAKAQEDTADIRLGSPAVSPDEPKSRGLAVLALLAALLGGLAGLVAAGVREVFSNGRRGTSE